MASTVKIILVVGGIFVAGAVTGGFVSLRVADHLARQKQAQQRLGPTEIGARLAQQLQLTPEQKAKLHPLINQTSEDLRKIRREAFSQTAALIEKMDAAMSLELSDAQRVLLKEVRAKEEERRKKWMAERAKRNEGRSSGGPKSEDTKPPAPPPAP